MCQTQFPLQEGCTHYNRSSTPNYNERCSEKKKWYENHSLPLSCAETSEKKWVRVCGSLCKTLALFRTTKVCYCPDPLFTTLFQTWLINSSLVQSDIKGVMKGYCSKVSSINSVKKELLVKRYTQFKTGVQKPYPINLTKLYKTISCLWPNCINSIHNLWPKRLKNDSLWGRTYSKK